MTLHVSGVWAWHGQPIEVWNGQTDTSQSGTIVRFRVADSQDDWRHFVLVWETEPTEAEIVDAIERHPYDG